MKPNNPIGIFDSGLGGLTILKAVRRRLPQEDLIYFGDTANVPYGGKSAQAVTRLSLAVARFLQEQRVKLIIVACNTASALALEELKKNISVPVVGVIEPGALKAVSSTQNGRIAVIGTEGTVQSDSYRRQILKLNPRAKVTQTACPLFVPLVEEGWAGKPLTELAARDYLAPVLKSNADTLILGCTHYPVLKRVIARVLGKNVKLVDSAETLAEYIKMALEKTGHAKTAGKGKLKVYASDRPERFKRLAKHILRSDLDQVALKKLD